jgi:hypothetical protein
MNARGLDRVLCAGGQADSYAHSPLRVTNVRGGFRARTSAGRFGSASTVSARRKPMLDPAPKDHVSLFDARQADDACAQEPPYSADLRLG